MLVIVVSNNPVKVKAVENVLSRFLKVTVIMKGVQSQVPLQPIGLEATVDGAVSRAKNALAAVKEADLGVGIEAGLVLMPGTITGYMDQQFACIVDRNGRVTLGGGPSFEYPPMVIDRVLSEGVEVGTVMDEISGINELGQKQGAIGYFSQGNLSRTELTELAVLMAFLPRLNSELYFNQKH